jgi:15-cis-phytoene synthase
MSSTDAKENRKTSSTHVNGTAVADVVTPRLGDFRECEALMRGGSKSFFAASRVLPARVRAPAIALYAFCRMADDAIDLNANKTEAMIGLGKRLADIYAQTPADFPADRAFAEVVRQFDIPFALPAALLEGFEWDAHFRQYETLHELQDYATRVAGTVGAMMALIMGAASPQAIARACELGVAMQLTNIARDVGEDAIAGRLYLPRQWLREEGIDPDTWMRQPLFQPPIGRVVSRLLSVADELYARAEEGVAELPRDCRSAIQAARLVYAEIGRVVEQQGLNSVDRRAVVSGQRKFWLVALASTFLIRPSRTPKVLPPLPAVKFLMDAVANAQQVSPSAADQSDIKVTIEGRAAWLYALFARLAERDRVRAVEGRSQQ